MRSKTRGVRRKLSGGASPKPSFTTTATSSLRLRNLNEANVECNIDRILPETSNESDEDQDNDGRHDSIDETNVCAKRRRGLSPSQDCGIIDWLEGETCIRCDRGGGQVLVCSETGCPVALHEKCMNCKPKFDGMGNFYCPYCWYKRELVRTRELRKKAMLAKKALSNFMDSQMVGGNTKKQEDGRAFAKGPNTSPLDGDKNCCDCGNGMDSDEVGNQSVEGEEDLQNDRDIAKPADRDQRRIVVEHQTDPLPPIIHGSENFNHSEEGKALGVESTGDSISEERLNKENISRTHELKILEFRGRIQAENLREVDDSQNEKIVENQKQAEPLNACCIEEGKIVDVSLHVSTKGTCGTVKISEENESRREGEEQTHTKASASTTSSAGGDTAVKLPANASVEFESCDSDTEKFLLRRRRVKKRTKNKAESQNLDSPNKSSSQPNNTPEKTTRTRNVKQSSSKKLRQRGESSEKFKNPTFANEKRKRLHWKPEEEEMLKEGVQKFSTAVNKNLPWRKILEFGRHVFDVSRTPIDLKDKWRNIMARESSEVKSSLP